jgi:hypothetical protein
MSKIRKQTVELESGAASTSSSARPSRIRREPPPQPTGLAKLSWLPEGRERETWTVVAGVMMFGVLITFLILFFSDYTSK